MPRHQTKRILGKIRASIFRLIILSACISSFTIRHSTYAQAVLRGPLTTNSPAIKAAGNGGLIDALTNNFFRVPAQCDTNLVITNLSLGQVIRIEVWPTNGFNVTFAQQTASNSMQGWVRPLSSNQWNTIHVSRPDSTTTNFDVRAADYIETAGMAITRTTNFAARSVTTAASAVGTLSTNGVLVSSAWTNFNVIFGPGMDARTTNANGKVDMELRPKIRQLFGLTSNVTVTNTVAATSLITNALNAAQSVPANTLTTNSLIHIRASGYFTSVSAATTEVGIRFNNLTLIATNLLALGTTLVNDMWTLDCDIQCRSTGGSGSVMANGWIAVPSSTGAAASLAPKRIQKGLLASTTTIDTTVDQVVDVYITPGATTHGFTTTTCYAEIIQ